MVRVLFEVETADREAATGLITQLMTTAGVKSLSIRELDAPVKPLRAPVRAEILPPSEQAPSLADEDSDEVDVDTVIVPAQKDGFERVFLGENRWKSVRIHDQKIPNLKWIAAYQVDPVRAITHVAPVLRIEPSDEPGKEDYKQIVFAGPAREIEPIPYGRKLKPGAMRGMRYTSFDRLSRAKSVADLMRLDPVIVWDLISRPGGATVADIREATGYTGVNVIESGPRRVAEAHGYRLLVEGQGEDRRFSVRRA